MRYGKASSRLEELTSGAFQEVIGDPQYLGNEIRRILLCSGKVYYDLVKKREELGRNDVAIIRIEQLYPFPLQRLTDILRRYSDNAELFWVQEEPENMGAWYFVEEQMQSIMCPGVSGGPLRRPLRYVGRPTAASPAPGAHKVHHDQQEASSKRAFRKQPLASFARLGGWSGRRDKLFQGVATSINSVFGRDSLAEFFSPGFIISVPQETPEFPCGA